VRENQREQKNNELVKPKKTKTKEGTVKNKEQDPSRYS
jgi:hypothetical protein